MRVWLFFISMLIGCLAFCQTPDTITVIHKYYSSTFDRTKHYPVVVKYWLTKDMISCNERVHRTNNFKADPLLPKETSLDADYKYSGYDRGHNMDAYDCGCDVQGMNESFYYSNMCPQTPKLNRGQWKRLEEYTRNKALQYDSVLVWCGSVSISDEHIGKVSVPDYCWKIILIKKTGIIEAYSLLNDKELSMPFEMCKVSVDSVYHLSGFVFNHK